MSEVDRWLAWTVVRAAAGGVAVPRALASVLLGVSEAGVALVGFGAAAGRGGREPALVAEAGRRLSVRPVPELSRPDRTAEAAAELADYLAGRRETFGQPVDWRLTHGDQQTVLRMLYQQVGYGETITYGELAGRRGAYREGPESGAGQAARRVGAIMGSNPVPVIVPCHRVLAANGLGGFGGGLEAKRWLLGLEGVLPPTLF